MEHLAKARNQNVQGKKKPLAWLLRFTLFLALFASAGRVCAEETFRLDELLPGDIIVMIARPVQQAGEPPPRRAGKMAG